MPRGKPRTLAERKARHKRLFGSLENFPQVRKYKNRR